ncbi:hypothetical protein ACWGJX_46965 [Streptomyces sp. NPDC054775]
MGARVEDYVTVGQQEHGYAVGRTYTGTGAPTALTTAAVRQTASLGRTA